MGVPPGFWSWRYTTLWTGAEGGNRDPGGGGGGGGVSFQSHLVPLARPLVTFGSFKKQHRLHISFYYSCADEGIWATQTKQSSVHFLVLYSNFSIITPVAFYLTPWEPWKITPHHMFTTWHNARPIVSQEYLSIWHCARYKFDPFNAVVQVCKQVHYSVIIVKITRWLSPCFCPFLPSVFSL